MAKSKEKNLALKLRQEGKSIKEIAEKLSLSKSTVSLWCRDIVLSKKQMSALYRKMLDGRYKGRIKGAKIQYKRRIEREKRYRKEGLVRIGRLSDRDFLITGVALYWGEGHKNGREVRITNSDPEIIRFMLKWFKRVLKIDRDKITLYIIINRVHKKRVKEVEEWWSRITRFPKENFLKTTLIKSENKKKYKNFPYHYGTLTIRLKNPVNLHNQIIGMIEALKRE
jgi:hypothetical protein